MLCVEASRVRRFRVTLFLCYTHIRVVTYIISIRHYVPFFGKILDPKP